MGVSYVRTIKPGYANDWDSISEVVSNVRRVIAGIVHEDFTSDEFISEVKIQMQPRVDGALAVMGWIGRDAIAGIPDENFNEEIEEVPQEITIEMAQQLRETAPVADMSRNPFNKKPDGV
jgi:hypothetical protein